MNTNPLATFIVAWFAAAGATSLITNTTLLAWFRLVHKARYDKRAAELLNNTINKMSPDDPRRWKLLRRYEILVAYGSFPGCYKCVGFWMYVLAATTSWLSLSCPGTLWGVPSWFALPTLIVAGWWIFVVLDAWLEPPSNAPVTVLRS